MLWLVVITSNPSSLTFYILSSNILYPCNCIAPYLLCIFITYPPFFCLTITPPPPLTSSLFSFILFLFFLYLLCIFIAYLYFCSPFMMTSCILSNFIYLSSFLSFFIYLLQPLLQRHLIFSSPPPSPSHNTNSPSYRLSLVSVSLIELEESTLWISVVAIHRLD